MRSLISLALLTSLAGCSSPAEPERPGGGPGDDPLYATFFSDPVWHPAGRHLAVEHVDSLDTDLDGRPDREFAGVWFVDAATGERRPALDGYTDPAWSPDGNRLAVVRGAQVFVVDVGDGGTRPVLPSLRPLTAEARNFRPSWSPDGTQIAFESDRAIGRVPGAFGFALYTVDIGTGAVRDISAHGTGEWRSAHWGGDGAIVFERYVPDGSDFQEVGRVRPDGSGLERLTRTESAERVPRHSVAAGLIAFAARTGGASRLGVMRPEGTGYRLLPVTDASSFDWSPDGRRLVVLRHNPLSPAPWSGQLWVFNADGSGARQLTNYVPRGGRKPINR